jgi:hypothetical protein
MKLCLLFAQVDSSSDQREKCGDVEWPASRINVHSFHSQSMSMKDNIFECNAAGFYSIAPGFDEEGS